MSECPRVFEVVCGVNLIDKSGSADAGPRLLEFHPAIPVVYVVHELTAVVSVLRLDLQTGALDLLQDVATLPDDVTPSREHNRGSADVHVRPDGRELYVSSRTDMSIVVYAVDPHGATWSQCLLVRSL